MAVVRCAYLAMKPGTVLPAFVGLDIETHGDPADSGWPDLVNADVETPVLGQLSAIRAEVDKIDDDLRDFRQRVSSMERHLANLRSVVAPIHGDVALVNQRLDRQGERLDRIDRRLDLTGTPA